MFLKKKSFNKVDTNIPTSRMIRELPGCDRVPRYKQKSSYKHIFNFPSICLFVFSYEMFKCRAIKLSLHVYFNKDHIQVKLLKYIFICFKIAASKHILLKIT